MRQELCEACHKSSPKPAGVTPGYCDPQEGEMSSSLMGGSPVGKRASKDGSNQTGVGNTTILSGREAGGGQKCYNYRRRGEAPFTMEL
jgi:hypothetical protein